MKRLIDQQETLSKASNAAMVGREVEVLVQGRGKRNPNQLIGRSSCFRTTVLPADEHTAAGDLVRARVSGATSHTLFAEPIAR